MKTTESATSATTDPPEPHPRAHSRGIVRRGCLGFSWLCDPGLPSDVVLPGPLKGNGSPARFIAVVSFGLVVLGFVVVRRTAHARRVSPGAMILLLYFLLWVMTYGVGLLDFSHRREVCRLGEQNRSLVVLIAYVGVALYVLARVRTARQRDFVLGCLAVGLAFVLSACCRV